jgi:hypothetical protein
LAALEYQALITKIFRGALIGLPTKAPIETLAGFWVFVKKTNHIQAKT